MYYRLHVSALAMGHHQVYVEVVRFLYRSVTKYVSYNGRKRDLAVDLDYMWCVHQASWPWCRHKTKAYKPVNIVRTTSYKIQKIYL
jgi:hypothetical protein